MNITSFPQKHVVGSVAILEDRLILGLLERHHCCRDVSSEQLDLEYDNYRLWGIHKVG